MMLAEQLAARRELVGEAFNFSAGIPMTVSQLARRILRLMESGLEPQVLNETSNEIRRQFLSSAKAQRMLGWEPLYTLDQGLERTIHWYLGFFGVDVSA
jgi:CDP-glucose 4,6-dehydratase